MQWAEGLKSACITVSDFDKTGSEHSVLVEPAHVRDAARRLYKEKYFIEDITVLDVAEGFQALYHFDHFESPGRVTLRVLAPHDDPKIPSIADIFQGAEWHERESMDFYSVVFTDNPNPERLLLPEDADYKPLEKEEDARVPMLDMFVFNELVQCAPDHSMAEALQEKFEAMKEAEAKAQAEAEAKAAAEAEEKAKAEAAEGGEDAAGEKAEE